MKNKREKILLENFQLLIGQIEIIKKSKKIDLDKLESLNNQLIRFESL